MERRQSYVLVALIGLLLLTDIVIAQSDGGKGNGNNGKGNEVQVDKGKGDNGKSNGNGPKDKEQEKKDKEKAAKDKKEKEKKDKEEKEKKDKERKEKEKKDKLEKEKKDKERKEKERKEKERKAKEKKDKEESEAAARYRILSPLPTGQEQAMCQGRGSCYYKTLVCPGECPKRKPTKNKNTKGCFIDCTNKCEATCKWRKTNCNGYGSLCYDPRFVGGDGVMFYFHGSKGGNFAIVSDNNLQINAHFIGTRPVGRIRDFTWVQALNVMFENHKLVITANRVNQWDETSDAFTIRYDGELITLPEDEQSEWREISGQKKDIIIERTDERNSVRVLVSDLVQMDIRVRPIGKEENRVHNYQLPQDDAFAHLETQFKFLDLSELVEGVLGKTYRPDYVSSAKTGVPMPVLGGEDKYQTPSLFSPTCRLCRFKPQEESLSADI
uniref:AT5g60530/muf9_180 n=1 Tax=Arabidopsis thaliana TaxID=3702 RepID=Q940M3_ARATH|nr:AT5g60530/muf9_180 [Arabidopsis thaliana]